MYQLIKRLQLLGDFVPQTSYRGIALNPTGNPALALGPNNP